MAVGAVIVPQVRVMFVVALVNQGLRMFVIELELLHNITYTIGAWGKDVDVQGAWCAVQEKL